MSGICWLMIGDGRTEVHERSLASAREMLPRPDHVVVVDDSEHSRGFSGAIAEGWGKVVETSARWIVHIELDFLFNQTIPVDRMIAVLEEHKYLAQVALKRQPWNAEERAAGGIVELHADDFTQRVLAGDIWTEHRRFFTTNPSVYSTNLCHHGWPQQPQSEGLFTHRLLDDPNVRFAFWGAKYDPPLVEHIGTIRTGNGY